MGLLSRNRQHNLQQIDSKVYFFMEHPMFLTNVQQRRQLHGSNPRAMLSCHAQNKVSLLTILGPDCSGPSVVECYCKACQKKTDRYEPMPFSIANRHVNRKRKT
jgi:hypothetical protein